MDAAISSVITAIAALNDLSQADVQSAMTAQGYTTVRAALLDNLDAAVSAVLTAIAALNDVSVLDIDVQLTATHGAGSWQTYSGTPDYVLQDTVEVEVDIDDLIIETELDGEINVYVEVE